MTVKTISLWEGVPDADKLRLMLATARDAQAPLTERQYALSYLTGSVKVLANIEKRQALSSYLSRQILSIKAKLYYSKAGHDGQQAHG
jgi:hypothetical protein